MTSCSGPYWVDLSSRVRETFPHLFQFLFSVNVLAMLMKSKDVSLGSSSQSVSTHSDVSNVSSSTTLPFIDSLAQVASPILNLTNVRKLIDNYYGKFLSGYNRISHWSLGLPQHIVPETFSFLEFFELCAKCYDPRFL
jgi:hypothetical protein